MPSSHPYQLNDIVELIRLVDPKTMLDVGVGFGKYGFLAREYLELWDGREQYGQRTRRIDGIEAFPQYILPHHRLIYDHLYVGDALAILPTLELRYDLITAVDILEHFDYENGMKFLQACCERAHTVVISTPFYVGAQGASHGNPYQTHRFQWERRHFRHFPHRCFVAHDSNLIVCLGDNAPRIRRELRYGRLWPRLRRCFPFLVTVMLVLKGRLWRR